MSLDGNVCFFIMYHYETNAIFPTPIPGLDSKNILDAYTKNFEYLMGEGYTPRINIMDNQAMKAIISCLTPQQCHLQLVEAGNHRVNVDERAIQTFINCFIGALGTTDIVFQSNCGTSLHHRCKTPSTSFKDCRSILTYQHMKHSRGRMIGIVSLLHLLEQRH